MRAKNYTKVRKITQNVSVFLGEKEKIMGHILQLVHHTKVYRSAGSCCGLDISMYLANRH